MIDYKPKTTKKILPIERIWQRHPGIERPNSACGPTTGAMIVSYLEKTVPHLQPASIRTRAMLVNELYKIIGTKPWGTSTRQWRRGMKRYLNSNDPTKTWDVNKRRGIGNFSLYCQSIDQGYPVILRFTFHFSKEAFASHHYVVGVGYKIVGNRQLVAVKDPDAGEKNTEIHWIDWEQNEHYIKMLVLSHVEK